MTQKNQSLIQLQDKLNKNFEDYAAKEFQFHLENFKQIEPILSEREKYIKDIPNFWSTSLTNSELGKDQTSIDYSFITSLVVKYEEEFWCSVVVCLKENPFVKNNKLIRRFNIMTEELVMTNPDWIKKNDNVFLNFFETNEVDCDMFDLLYDIYVNAIDYYYNEKI
ncbi:hypothetical protein COBT_003508 [Conglomerata obtusa]